MLYNTVVRPPHGDTSPEGSVNGVGSTGIPDWQRRDWDDYDFSPGEGDCVGGGGGPGAVCAGLKLCCAIFHCPVPAAGDVPGMTVEEAIEVLHTTYYISCHTSCYVTYMTCYVV